MIAVEIDGRAVELLEQTYPAPFTVLHSDVLAVDYTKLAAARGGRLSVIGNLPYYITSQILFCLCDHHASVSRAVVTMQHEVALRLVYNPRCRVSYYDLDDPNDLDRISKICVDAVEEQKDDPLKLLVVRCATCRHVYVDRARGITPCMVAASVQETPSVSLQHDFVRVDASDVCVKISRTRAEMINSPRRSRIGPKLTEIRVSKVGKTRKTPGFPGHRSRPRGRARR